MIKVDSKTGEVEVAVTDGIIQIVNELAMVIMSTVENINEYDDITTDDLLNFVSEGIKIRRLIESGMDTKEAVDIILGEDEDVTKD